MVKKRVIAENPLAYTVRDGYPVTELHTLLIPRRHVADYFDLIRPEERVLNADLETIYNFEGNRSLPQGGFRLRQQSTDALFPAPF